jgi:hypothetical protein
LGEEIKYLNDLEIDESDVNNFLHKSQELNMDYKLLKPLLFNEPLYEWFINNSNILVGNINEDAGSDINKEEVLLYIFKSWYKLYEDIQRGQYNIRQDNIIKAYGNYDLSKEKQYCKYRLVSLISSRELLDIEQPRIYNGIIDKTIYLRNVCLELAKELKKLYREGLIKELSFLLSDKNILEGRHEEICLLEGVQFGKIFEFSSIGTFKSVTKLYSDKLEEALWVTIDNENITFEETRDDFICHNDCVVTQVLHFEYKEGDKKYYITHFDHEYIFYTFEEYDIRINDITKKGTGQKRIKSFKADKCMIPIDYMTECVTESSGNNSQESYNKCNIFFMYFILECYFEHKELLKEYFLKFI